MARDKREGKDISRGRSSSSGTPYNRPRYNNSKNGDTHQRSWKSNQDRSGATAPHRYNDQRHVSHSNASNGHNQAYRSDQRVDPKSLTYGATTGRASSHRSHQQQHGQQDEAVTTYSVETIQAFDIGAATNLIRVHTTINGHRVNALIDTGATVSLFNVRIATIQPDPTLANGPVWIVSALQNMKAKAIGYANLRVNFENKTSYCHKFLLTDKSNEDAILGVDFLSAHGFVINTQQRTIVCNTTSTEVHCNSLSVRDRIPATSCDQPLYALEDTVIIPAATVDIQVESKELLAAGSYAIKSDQSARNRPTAVAERVFEVLGGKRIAITCPVRNLSTSPVTIRAGERLATAERVNEIIVQTDWANQQTLVPSIESFQHDLEHLDPDGKSKMQEVLNSDKSVFYVEGSALKATHLTQHQIHLKPGSEPAYTAQYPLPQVQLDAAKKLVLDMLHQGIIEPTLSPYNSPIVLVKKANGDWRFVTDFRRLNNITVPDRFPMARTDDIFRDLQGMKYFTTVDMQSGFWQVEIA